VERTIAHEEVREGVDRRVVLAPDRRQRLTNLGHSAGPTQTRRDPRLHPLATSLKVSLPELTPKWRCSCGVG
jgi:hypothetical protein